MRGKLLSFPVDGLEAESGAVAHKSAKGVRLHGPPSPDIHQYSLKMSWILYIQAFPVEGIGATT